MKKFLSKGWNIFEIALLSSWASIAIHMGKVLDHAATDPHPDVASLLFTVKQAAAVLFYGGILALVVKSIDSPLQNDLDEWAGLLVHRKVSQSPPTPAEPPAEKPIDVKPTEAQPPK